MIAECANIVYNVSKIIILNQNEKKWFFRRRLKPLPDMVKKTSALADPFFAAHFQKSKKRYKSLHPNEYDIMMTGFHLWWMFAGSGCRKPADQNLLL